MEGVRRQTLFRAAETTVVASHHGRPVGRTAMAAWLCWVIVFASCMTVLSPFLAVSVPPLVDFPNHLARFWLLAGGVKDPALARFYDVDWSRASTNIGVDVAVTSLSVLVPAKVVAFLAALIAAAGPPLGLLALSRVVFDRFHPWQVLFPLTAWSTTFLMGFLNFQIGVAMALLVAAADPWLRRRLAWGVGPARTALATILAVDHLYALLLYAALVGALAFGAALPWRDGWRALWSRIVGASIATVWCLIPLLLLVALAPMLPGADPQSDGLVYGWFGYKLFALLTPLSAYNLFVGIALTSLLLGATIWLARRGALQIHGGLALVAAALVALSLFAPDHAAGGSWIAQRFPTLALIVFLAAVRLTSGVAVRWGFRFMAPAMILVVAQAAWVTWNWRALEGDMTAVRRAIVTVPPGARILPLQHDPTIIGKLAAPSGRYMSTFGDPTFRHYAALATPLRRAFVPNLFSARGLQPLRVVGDWDRRVEHNGGPLASMSALGRPWRGGDPLYLRGWRSDFDYLLVMNADLPDVAGPFQPPPGVILISDTGFAQLWKVDAAPRPAGPLAKVKRN